VKTAQTADHLLNGAKDSWPNHKASLKEMQTTNKNKVIINMKFGAYVIIASVSLSACATDGVFMSAQELENFEINCSKRTEQVAFLESQRSTDVDRQNARLENFFKPWKLWTERDDFEANTSMGSGQQEWIINQKLMRINSACQGR
jgi:hypothetical protein